MRCETNSTGQRSGSCVAMERQLDIPPPPPLPRDEAERAWPSGTRGRGETSSPHEWTPNGSLSPGERVAEGRERGRMATVEDERIRTLSFSPGAAVTRRPWVRAPNAGSSLKEMSNQAAQDVPRALDVFHASTNGMRMPPFARELRQRTADVDCVNRRGACGRRCRQSLQD